MKYKYILFVSLIVASSIFLLLTFNNTEKQKIKENQLNNIHNDDKGLTWDDAKKYNYVPIANQGTSLGIVNEKHDNLIEKRNFSINESKEFEKTIAITNQNNFKQDYLIIPLINYKQKNITLAGEMQNKIRVNLDPGEIVFIPFSISLDKGFHDFTFLIVPDSANTDLSEEYRLSTTGSNLMTIRGTIDKNSKGDSLENEYYTLDKHNKEKLDGLLLTKNKDLTPWLTHTVNNKKNKINFYINVGNVDKKNKKFVLVSFLNWNQVGVNQNNEIFYGELQGESSGRIKGQIPKENIKNNLISNYTVLLIPYPHEDIDPLKRDFIIQPSGRIGIDNR